MPVPSYVALLRAINVSGKRPVPMARLRALLESLGLEDVRTYLQSGNVVFRSRITNAGTLEKRISAAMPGEFGFPVEVHVRNADDFRRVVERNPYPSQAAADPTKVVAVLFFTPPDAKTLATLEPPRGEVATFLPGPQEAYLNSPAGFGNSKLNLDFFERKLKVLGTARNWRTMLALAEMAAS